MDREVMVDHHQVMDHQWDILHLDMDHLLVDILVDIWQDHLEDIEEVLLLLKHQEGLEEEVEEGQFLMIETGLVLHLVLDPVLVLVHVHVVVIGVLLLEEALVLVHLLLVEEPLALVLVLVLDHALVDQALLDAAETHALHHGPLVPDFLALALDPVLRIKLLGV